VLEGVPVRRSLDLTSWEAANRTIRELEIHGEGNAATVKVAAERFLADRASMKLSDAMMRKYRSVAAEREAAFGDMFVRAVTTDDVRRVRDAWKLAPITMQKRMEMVRKFFAFCEDSDWVEKNPAKAVETPPVKYDPTLPFTAEQMEKILWAAESIREAHPKIPEGTEKKLLALILLMRYSGIRISDAVMFRRQTLKDGKLFLRQEKTKHPVWVPLPKHVVKAVMACDEGDAYFFYRGVGTPKSAITEWQQRLKLVYVGRRS
jgi:integrase